MQSCLRCSNMKRFTELQIPQVIILAQHPLSASIVLSRRHSGILSLLSFSFHFYGVLCTEWQIFGEPTLSGTREGLVLILRVIAASDVFFNSFRSAILSLSLTAVPEAC